MLKNYKIILYMSLKCDSLLHIYEESAHVNKMEFSSVYAINIAIHFTESIYQIYQNKHRL